MSRPENVKVAAEKPKGVLFKERIVDIYVSAESLFVYDKPWMEGDSTGAAVDNEYAEVAVASEQKKACRIRAVLPWLLVFLLLVVITGLGIMLQEEKIKWNIERKQVMANHFNETNTLRTELDQVQEKLCVQEEKSTKCQPNVNQTGTLREVLDRVQKKLCEQIGCTDNWKRLHCSCYSIFRGKKDKGRTWKASQKHCEGEKAHLVTVTTTEEQEFVLKLPLANTAWVGLKYDNDEVWWWWVDGTLLPTESFGSHSQSQGDCALVDNTDPALPWRPSTCKSKHNWICEKRIE